MAEPLGPELEAEEALTLAPGSPGRTDFLLRTAHRVNDVLTRGDVGALQAACEPDVKVYILRDEAGNLWASDLDPVYQGPDAVVRAFEVWAEPWEELRLELTELIDLGQTHFIVVGMWHGRGRGSGVEVATAYTARYTLRGDRIARLEFIDLERTLRELGL